MTHIFIKTKNIFNPNKNNNLSIVNNKLKIMFSLRTIPKNNLKFYLWFHTDPYFNAYFVKSSIESMNLMCLNAFNTKTNKLEPVIGNHIYRYGCNLTGLDRFLMNPKSEPMCTQLVRFGSVCLFLKNETEPN
jgi:hypothetical protein